MNQDYSQKRSFLQSSRNRWASETLRKTVEGHPERRSRFRTTSGIPLQTIYLPDDLHERDYQKHIGFPGEYPYVRGINPNMYRGRLWTMRQYAGYGNPEETNSRFKFLLKQGQNGLSIAFDLPTQIGYDPDHPASLGEVGRVGVSVSTLDDMEILLDGIPLSKVSTSMTINAPASIILAMYISVAKRRGIDPKQLRGTIQNDILKEYIARGTYIFPPHPSMRLITDINKFCAEFVPHWNTISISGYHIREAGSTAVQEIAFAIANGIAYVDATIASGLPVDSFAPQLSFFFNSHNQFLEEIAKFRAARRLWAQIMKERFGANDPKSMMLRFHTQTGGSTLTSQEPENNMTRVAIQALAAVLGGTQSLHTNAMDEALSLPTEKAALAALRTQQIIANETGVSDTVDALGGSYVIEALTDAIETQAKAYIQRIDEFGGAIAAIEAGYQHHEIHEAAYAFQKDLETKEEIVVGLNSFENDDLVDIDTTSIDPNIELQQIQKLLKIRERRDNERVSALRSHLSAATHSPKNIMPVIIECVENQVTIGEICDTMRGEWGEHKTGVAL